MAPKPPDARSAPAKPWRSSSSAGVSTRPSVNFPPEEFHIRLLQQVGNMRGVEGSTAKLYTVTPASVRYVSRHYWIRSIDLAPDDGQH